jgi:Fuc2NAc and GlcNAc transferase
MGASGACGRRVASRDGPSVILAAIVAVSGVLAAVLTGAIRRYAIARNLLDHPNQRSSHTIATPRGGGVAIVVAATLAVVGLGVAGHVAWRDALVVLGAGALLAVVGFVDDRGHVAARWRFLTHVAAAAMVVLAVGPPPGLTAIAPWFGVGWLVVMALYLVWLINLTNFMDGIDGIASSEVITTCLGAALLARATGLGGAAQLLPVALAGATAGFLIWNWPPARIFMGDAGSGFLGITIGTLSLMAARASRPLFVAWLILFGVFLVDSTVTLITRVIRGKRIYEAHREHAYQRVSRARGHRFVTLCVVAINVVWLAPIAALVATQRLHEILGLAVALTPLVALAFRLGSGRAEA